MTDTRALLSGEFGPGLRTGRQEPFHLFFLLRKATRGMTDYLSFVCFLNLLLPGLPAAGVWRLRHWSCYHSRCSLLTCTHLLSREVEFMEIVWSFSVGPLGRLVLASVHSLTQSVCLGGVITRLTGLVRCV
jgi:hypothetical protein